MKLFLLFVALLASTLAIPAPPPVRPKVYSTALYREKARNTLLRPLLNGKDPRVFGDVYPVAIFWVYVSVGTPPVKFPVAVDSGSYTLDIPLAGCDGCVTAEPNAQYDASKSSTSEPHKCSLKCKFSGGCDGGQCGFSNTYETCDLSNPVAPCTIKGKYFTDVLSFGGLGPVNVTFGAISYQTTNFDQFKNIDGVMGMGGPKGQSNVFQTLVDSGYIDKAIWSICFHHGRTSNGTFSIGGADPRLYTGDVSWVDNTQFQDLYSMDLSAITFGSGASAKNLEGLQRTAILDSGTNVLLLPDEGFASVEDVLKSYCSDSVSLTGVCGVSHDESLFNGKCFSYSDADLAQFPPLSITVQNKDKTQVVLEMSPTDYLIPEAQSGKLCLAIRPTGPGGILIIGDTTMQNYLTIFDNEQERIGWARVNKDNCGSI